MSGLGQFQQAYYELLSIFYGRIACKRLHTIA